MKKFLIKIVDWLTYFALASVFALRYRVKVVGTERFKDWKMPNGALLFANHPSFLDGLFVTNYAVRCGLRLYPWILDTELSNPFINFILSINKMTAGFVETPDFGYEITEEKLKKLSSCFLTTKKLLNEGQPVLLFPSGRVQDRAVETIGGSSAAYKLFHENPKAKVILVRSRGFWGSRFSRAISGRPNLVKAAADLFKVILSNLIFFSPRRNMTIEFFPVDRSLLEGLTKEEFNRAIEGFFNGTGAIGRNIGPDRLTLVPNYFYYRKYPIPTYQPRRRHAEMDASMSDIYEELKRIIVKHSQVEEWRISPFMNFHEDLNVDSLELVSILAAVRRRWGIEKIDLNKLDSIGFLAHLIYQHKMNPRPKKSEQGQNQ